MRKDKSKEYKKNSRKNKGMEYEKVRYTRNGKHKRKEMAELMGS